MVCLVTSKTSGHQLLALVREEHPDVLSVVGLEEALSSLWLVQAQEDAWHLLRVSLSGVRLWERVTATPPYPLKDALVRVLLRCVRSGPEEGLVLLGKPAQTADMVRALPESVRACVLGVLCLPLQPEDDGFLPVLLEALGQEVALPPRTLALEIVHGVSASRSMVGVVDVVRALKAGEVAQVCEVEGLRWPGWSCGVCLSWGVGALPPACLSCGVGVDVDDVRVRVLELAGEAGVVWEEVASCEALEDVGSVGAMLREDLVMG